MPEPVWPTLQRGVSAMRATDLATIDAVPPIDRRAATVLRSDLCDGTLSRRAAI